MQVMVGAEYGNLRISTDYGKTWSTAQNAPFCLWEGVAVSSDGNTMIAVASNMDYDPYRHHAGVYVSRDRGTTWTRPEGVPHDARWTAVSCS
eukprot:34967-Eustigmatos_ZCMA.PRE.1